MRGLHFAFESGGISHIRQGAARIGIMRQNYFVLLFSIYSAISSVILPRLWHTSASPLQGSERDALAAAQGNGSRMTSLARNSLLPNVKPLLSHNYFAIVFNSSALSVFSQLKPARPKCP